MNSTISSVQLALVNVLPWKYVKHLNKRHPMLAAVMQAHASQESILRPLIILQSSLPHPCTRCCLI